MAPILKGCEIMRTKRKIKLKRKQKKQITLLALVILVASIASVMLLTPGFNIDTIKVYGNSIVKSEDIIKSSGITTNVNIFEVSLGKAKKNIEKMGYIDEAKVKRSLPSTITISVVEAAGVAYVPVKKGNAIITADGRVLEIVKDKEKEQSLPVVKGLENAQGKVGKNISADNKARLEALLDCLKEFSKDSLVFKMQQIDVSNITEITFTYNNANLTVRVGDTEKLDYKMSLFQPILDEIGGDVEGYIDLERKIYRKKEE